MRRRGASIIEVLIAISIMGVCIAALTSLFLFSFNLTRNSDERSTGYNIARRELERIRSEGFKNTIIVRDSDGNITSQGRDGTEVIYYSNQGTRLSSSSGATYSATVVVTSDKLDTLSGGGTRPAADALRTVIVTVRKISNSSVVFTDGTFIVRSGV
jgi:uncharacterized protein (TIGR02598 family)